MADETHDRTEGTGGVVLLMPSRPATSSSWEPRLGCSAGCGATGDLTAIAGTRPGRRRERPTQERQADHRGL
jgi:hypothetical protein